MRKVNLFLTAVILLNLTGCGWVEQIGAHVVSGTIKINRRVTLYSNSGSVIRTWEGRMNIEGLEGTAPRFMLDGKAFNIDGTYVIEEI